MRVKFKYWLFCNLCVCVKILFTECNFFAYHKQITSKRFISPEVCIFIFIVLGINNKINIKYTSLNR